MGFIWRRVAALAFAFACLLMFAALCGSDAAAQVPQPWQFGMQTAHSPVQRSIESLHDVVQVIIIAVTLFVGLLLAWVLWRYNANRNPTPSQTSHNTVIEVAWTVIPVLILVVIAIPSFRLIYFQDRTPNADMTIKATGHQWYWEYTYPDQGGLTYASYMVPQDELKPGQLRLLDVDNQLVVPAGRNVRILTTSTDVIHSFFIPSLGVQRYAIPGRTIETWVRVDSPGTYYGECNQVCGTNHNSMPISVKAIAPEDFNNWVEQAKTKFSAASPPRTDAQLVAANGPDQLAVTEIER
jgi:cytochrome c oxidase subunit 2